MMDIKWYNDQAAEYAYRATKARLEPVIVDLFPNYELSHFGINRNENTEEIIIKLHLNQLGQVRVVRTDQDDYLRIEGNNK